MSVSNTADVPLLTGQSINMEMIQNKPKDSSLRHTKIICTIGPSCWEKEQLEVLIDNGMDVARLNFSHGDHKGHGATLERIRAAATSKQKNVGILLDTKGPEIRSGFFKDGISKINLIKGNQITLTGDYSYKGDEHMLACSYEKIASAVNQGQQILIADGSLVLTVLSCNEDERNVLCRIENTASIGERKNMNLPGVVVDLPTFTEKDVDDIVNFGIKHNVDFIAASFVRKGSDVKNLRRLLADNGGQHIKVICKIENQEGLENYDEILQLSDAIMVARGDLGMEIPPSKVFLAQKYMIRKANIAGKPVITATQMLESMIQNPRPTRAECSDVANAVYDGTDCVMLSGETANGPYFREAVQVMAKTCVQAELSRNYNALFQSVRNSVINAHGRLSAGESLASSAVKTAIDIHAKFIIVLSETGTTARLVAKFRPGCLVICLTPNPTVARQSSGLLPGCRAYLVDSLEDTTGLAEEVELEALKAGVAKVGDLMVIVAGKTFGHGAADQIRVEPVSYKSYWDDTNHECNETAHSRGREDIVVGHLKSGFRLSG